MRFFSNLLSRVQLSPRTQRRLGRFGQRFFGWLAYPLQLVAGLFREIGRLLASWWSRRNVRFLLQGLPALVLAVGAMTFGVVVYFQDRNLLATNYNFAAKRALFQVEELDRAGKDTAVPLALAETCSRRLSTLRADDEDQRFDLALVLFAQKKHAEADAIMRKLAPADKLGHGRAHMWVAERLLKSEPRTQAMLYEAMRHLERAATWKKNGPYISVQAHSQLARLYRGLNDNNRAFEHQTEAAKYSPENAATLAFWYYELPEKKALGQNYLERAMTDFQKRLQDNVDDHVARWYLIQGSHVLGNFEAAKNHARLGTTMTTDPDLKRQYHTILAQTMVAEYDDKTLQNRWTSPAERYAFLEQILYQPGFQNDFHVLGRLAAFFRQEGAEGQKARKVFTDLRNAGNTSALANLILGIDAWQEEDLKEARYYWELAQEAAKERNSEFAPLIANNLAWVLANQAPVDLDRAKDLIDWAIEKTKSPSYRSTRGFILAKMDRHNEAMHDLEAGKEVYKNDPVNGPPLYRQLAETCQKLGLADSAADYQRYADELAAKASKNTPDPKKAGGTR